MRRPPLKSSAHGAGRGGYGFAGGNEALPHGLEQRRGVRSRSDQAAAAFSPNSSSGRSAIRDSSRPSRRRAAQDGPPTPSSKVAQFQTLIRRLFTGRACSFVGGVVEVPSPALVGSDESTPGATPTSLWRRFGSRRVVSEHRGWRIVGCLPGRSRGGRRSRAINPANLGRVAPG